MTAAAAQPAMRCDVCGAIGSPDAPGWHFGSLTVCPAHDGLPVPWCARPTACREKGVCQKQYEDGYACSH